MDSVTEHKLDGIRQGLLNDYKMCKLQWTLIPTLLIIVIIPEKGQNHMNPLNEYKQWNTELEGV